MNEGLSEEAKEIIEACWNSITRARPNRRITLDAIDMLIGYELEQAVIQELVNAGLLAHTGQGMYYVVEI